MECLKGESPKRENFFNVWCSKKCIQHKDNIFFMFLHRFLVDLVPGKSGMLRKVREAFKAECLVPNIKHGDSYINYDVDLHICHGAQKKVFIAGKDEFCWIVSMHLDVLETLLN